MLDIKNKMDGIKQHIIHFYRKDRKKTEEKLAMNSKWYNNFKWSDKYVIGVLTGV